MCNKIKCNSNVVKDCLLPGLSFVSMGVCVYIVVFKAHAFITSAQPPLSTIFSDEGLSKIVRLDET